MKLRNDRSSIVKADFRLVHTNTSDSIVTECQIRQSRRRKRKENTQTKNKKKKTKFMDMSFDNPHRANEKVYLVGANYL